MEGGPDISFLHLRAFLAAKRGRIDGPFLFCVCVLFKIVFRLSHNGLEEPGVARPSFPVFQ